MDCWNAFKAEKAESEQKEPPWRAAHDTEESEISIEHKERGVSRLVKNSHPGKKGASKHFKLRTFLVQTKEIVMLLIWGP